MGELRPPPAWGHASGDLRLVAPGTAAAEPGLRALLAEAVHRYGWAYDERRADLLAEAFTEDAVWEASIMGVDRVGPFRGRDAITAWLADFWPAQTDQRRHVLTNVVLQSAAGEPDRDRAEVVAYLILLASSDAATRIETAGFYRFALRREADGAWRIAHLFAGFDAPF